MYLLFIWDKFVKEDQQTFNEIFLYKSLVGSIPKTNEIVLNMSNREWGLNPPPLTPLKAFPLPIQYNNNSIKFF